MVITPTLDAFLNYNPAVGTEGLHITGFPGSGKSNMGNRIFLDCMSSGDMGILRGDRFAEWRHLVNYLKEYELTMEVLIPGWQYIKTVNVPDEALLNAQDCYINTVDYPIVNIMKFMEPRKIVVVCDFMYDLKDKGWTWVNIFEQLINRTEYINIPITYLDHEAGITLPEIALSDTKKSRSHWMAVNRICELFVDFRKGLIRPIFISQLEPEIKHQIREKCIFRVHKQGIISRRNPEKMQKRAPRLPLNYYILSVARELYNPNCIVDKLEETNEVWKMIPTKMLAIEETNGHISKRCNNCGYVWESSTKSPIKCPNCQSRKWNE
jgi:predicted Zn-ribbon and HTH transcriptional regulator